MKNKEIIIAGILAFAILVHGFITAPKKNRYEVVGINDTNWVLIDNQSGKIYRQYIMSDGGPTDWTPIEFPDQ